MNRIVTHGISISTKNRCRCSFIVVVLMLLTNMAYRSHGAVTTHLADDGAALQSVVVSSTASPQVRASATELAEMLTRITGAPFEVTEGDGSRGIVVGVYTNFANCTSQMDFAPEVPSRREDYVIRSHADGLLMIGATDLAVDQAIWGFLDYLGYRLFFLTDTWEVVPRIPSLSVELDVVDAPDYIARRAPSGAAWSNRELWQRWHKRNRVVSGLAPSTGHAYGNIIRANKAAFAEHPEYFALVNDERHLGGKFCISNPGLRRLVVDHAVRQMTNNPTLESISMDPSDGGSWCECPDCLEMGSVSDRVVILANAVAEGINNLGLGPRYVGMYAYNDHSPAPSVFVHSNLVVSVATSFIKGGFTVEELIEGWRKQGANLGIRDYLSVFPWTHNRPRQGHGADVNYLQRSIPYFYNFGARYMNACGTDSWACSGFGYWILPRIQWRVADAEKVEAMFDDFLDKAFGPAEKPMRAFYTLLNFDRKVYTDEHVTAMMYRYIAEAYTLAASRPDVIARLDDLFLYTRYVELYTIYQGASGGARQAGFEAVWRHTYRMRDRMMLSTVAICHREVFRDRSVKLPEGVEWGTPEGEHPWKDSTPFSREEINRLLAAGIDANQPVVLPFEPIEFSETLVPASRLSIPDTYPAMKMNLGGRGIRTFLTWLEKPGSLALEVQGGLIEHYRKFGNVKLLLFAAEEATLEAVAEDESTPPDGKTYPVTLRSPYAGQHTLEISDGNDSTLLGFPIELALTVHSTLGEESLFNRPWSLYFYVPIGTRIVGGFTADRNGRMRDATGKTTFDFSSMERAGYFSVPVEEGQDGTFWRLESCRGKRRLMTVPPYLADHPTRLLLPREVVEKDSQNKHELRK